MKRLKMSARAKLILALGVGSLISMGLYIAGAFSNHNSTFAYLPWNLLLAWLPLAFALWLEYVLRRKVWSSWYALVVTALWVLFLPNAFYMISDFVHLHELGRVDLLYDVVMFTACIFNATLIGFCSLYLVHTELLRRMRASTAALLIGLVLFLCSFAIYVGRELRWNSWDVLANPASLLVDISGRFLDIEHHPQVYTTTLSFFVLLTTMYGMLWFVAQLPRSPSD